MKTILEIKKTIKRKILEEIEEALGEKNTSHAIDLGKLLEKIRYTEKGDEDYNYEKEGKKWMN